MRCKRAEQQPPADHMGASSANTGEQSTRSSATRLVFGLNARANKLKHDEYAERRQQLAEQSAPDKKHSGAVGSGEAADSNGLAVAREGEQSSRAGENGNPLRSASPHAHTHRLTGASTSVPPADRGAKRVRQARADQQVPLAEQPSARRAASKSSSGSAAPNATQTASTSSSTSSAAQRAKSSDARERRPSPSAASRSRSGKDSVAQTEPTGSADSAKLEEKAKENGEEPAKRMQFNIPPPPPVQVGPAGKSSVVSYAKSRIYDRPNSRQQQQQLAGASLLLDAGAIPASIQSGIKPPKQVNVSQAREKWEGGEPFAKCKSRQRLAAQANKKLLHGGWSMASMVATQQLQLQQALANSGASARSSLERADGQVKVLSRGSVLERVQLFERAPEPPDSSSSSSSSTSSSSSVSPSSSSSSLADDRQCEPSVGAPAPTGKQAAYKHRLSAIQSSSGQQEQLAGSALSPQADGANLLLLARRRSLAGQRRDSSQSSLIPKFYQPNGKPNTYELELEKKNIVNCFDKFPERKASLSAPTYKRHFNAIALACGLADYFREPLWLYVKHQLANSNLLHNLQANGAGGGRKQSGLSLSNGLGSAGARTLVRAASIDTSTLERLQSQTYITCDQFLACWRQLVDSAHDLAAKFVHLLTLGKCNYLLADHFVPLIQSIIDDHPGLKFLRLAPDFHLRYIQTVIARIYFCVNRTWTAKITAAELRRSNLLAVLQLLGQEEDINQITDYFSYEHFYVIYCKFWTLDQDHDLLISRDDLARHNEAAISSRIIDRIFMGIVSKHIRQTGKMSYADFVWFLLAEEDKKHPRSIEYWFRLMDLDGDGYISMYEMEYFYYEQTKRLELMNIEPLPFLDSACQILDLVNPRAKNKISLADLKRTKMATIFFDTFINLEKYLEHESREFVSTRDCLQDGVAISDWDRYAQEEYESLVSEETSV